MGLSFGGSAAVSVVHNAIGSGGIELSGSGTVEHVTYPQQLLRAAQTYFDAGEFAMAVIQSHAACEVANARRWAASFADREIPHLQKPIEAFLSDFSLIRDESRNVFRALTALDLEPQPFWSAYAASIGKRKRIVQAAEKASEQEAQSALEAASSLVAFVERNERVE